MKMKKAMTPIAALFIFLSFIVIILLIIITWLVTFLWTREISCEGIYFNNVTFDNDVIFVNIINNNTAVIDNIDFYINDICKSSFNQEIKSESNKEMEIIVDKMCVPSRTLYAEIHLRHGFSETTCEIKNEIGS